MKDRVPGAPGQYTASVAAGEFAKLENGKPFSITLMRDDQPLVEGTPYSKAAVLPDEVAAALCPGVEDPTPADAFKALVGRTKAKAGFIYPLASETVPEGFLLCDGAAYSRTEYAELFEAIGTTYGAGDGSTTFHVPNLSTRVPVGAGDGFELGKMDGEAEHTLTVEEMPNHRHQLTDRDGNQINYNRSGATSGDGIGISLGETWDNMYTNHVGSNAAHNNMQPYTVVNYIIATGKGEDVGYVVAGTASGGDISVIDDTIVSAEKTWSSQKIADEIANIPGGGYIDVTDGEVITFTTEDFALPYAKMFGDKIVDDAKAYNYKAAALYAAGRVGETNNALNLNGKSLPVNMVDTNNVVTGVSILPSGKLLADGKYHLYKLDDVVPIKKDTYKFLYLFADWGFQVSTFAKKLAAYKNKEIDIYISMKIAGDFSFADANNLPVYYIDRIIVTDGSREVHTGSGVNGYYAVENLDHPGCYYMIVDEEMEWVNPPMMFGVEYRTTEKLNGVRVYTKAIYWGKGNTDSSLTILPAIEGNVIFTSVRVKAIDALNNKGYLLTNIASQELYSGSNAITVNTDGLDTSSMYILAEFKYIKI